MSTRPIRRALLAVYDKTGIVELARALRERDVQLVSSGGTAAALREAGVDVTEVADVTGFPEMLGGRVKTLHPRDPRGHARRSTRQAAPGASSRSRGSSRSIWSSCNLYPFRETVAAGASFDEAIEKIDIGGPAMVRASGEELRVGRGRREPGALRRDRGRARARRRAHAADRGSPWRPRRSRTPRPTTRAVAGWFAQQGADADALPDVRRAHLREGRGPALRGEPAPARRVVRRDGGPGPLGGAEVLQGKEMSFNNWLDAWAAAELVQRVARRRPA